MDEIEYKVKFFYIELALEKMLNEMAQNGWILINSDINKGIYIFSRKKQSNKQNSML